MNNPGHDELTRRAFLGSAAGGTAAVGLGMVGCQKKAASESKPAGTPASKPTAPVLPYGMLGRTKYPVTLISFGAILISEKIGTRLLKAAIDRGINLVHTSASYGKGKSIESVGGLFKGDKSYRDKVFFCLKTFNPNKETELDDMLKNLGIDHADVILTTLENPDIGRMEAIQAQQDALKKKGKVRHTGFVCHGDMNGVIEMVVSKAPQYFDMTLMSMRLVPIPGQSAGEEEAGQGQRFLKNLKELRKNGLGILSMKSGARKAVTRGDKVFGPHAKMYLEAGADSILTSINSFEQIEMVTKLDLKCPHPTPKEKQAAAEFLKHNATACLMCDACSKSCPQHLPIRDLMRCRMYHEEYDWVDHARAEYDLLNVDFRRFADHCGDCSACAKACPRGLAGPQTVRQVASLFA